jgi:glycosyltransferase involved in cell wall biosynthesis
MSAEAQINTGMPKITVVIPTRERLPVLRHAIQTVLQQNYSNLELIVSDNLSEDGTGDYVKAISDPRVRYVNTGQRLSMTGNWEFGLSNVKDGWVTFLGDDDGLLPGAILRIAELIAQTDCEAITFRACNYLWPGASGSDVGRLNVPMAKGSEVRDARLWLDRVTDARADYSDLPMIYVLGVIHMNLINRLKKDSRFFHSCIPDIYTSIACARSISKYLFVNEPIGIIGSSKFSNGASFQRSVTTREGEFKRFTSEKNLPFHESIPLLPNGSYPASWQMFVYEAYLQTAFLDKTSVSLAPARQLALALAHPYNAKLNDEINQLWGREFARLHSVNFEEALKKGMRLRRRGAVVHFFQRVKAALTTVIIYDQDVPLPNVYAASQLGSFVLWMRPSLGFRLYRVLRSILGKV